MIGGIHVGKKNRRRGFYLHLRINRLGSAGDRNFSPHISAG
jgi:hypothetical protein